MVIAPNKLHSFYKTKSGSVEYALLSTLLQELARERRTVRGQDHYPQSCSMEMHQEAESRGGVKPLTFHCSPPTRCLMWMLLLNLGTSQTCTLPKGKLSPTVRAFSFRKKLAKGRLGWREHLNTIQLSRFWTVMRAFLHIKCNQIIEFIAILCGNGHWLTQLEKSFRQIPR